MKNTLKYWGYVAKRTFLDGLPVVAGLLVAAIIFMALVHQDKAYPQEAEIFTYANPSLCTSVNRLAKELKELGFTPLMTAVNKIEDGRGIRVVIWINLDTKNLFVTETYAEDMACLVAAGSETRPVTSEEGYRVLRPVLPGIDVQD